MYFGFLGRRQSSQMGPACDHARMFKRHIVMMLVNVGVDLFRRAVNKVSRDISHSP